MKFWDGMEKKTELLPTDRIMIGDVTSGLPTYISIRDFVALIGSSTSTGASAYEIYTQTTTDNPILSEVDWIKSLYGHAGSVVTIGSNGDWFIDGVDTGVKTQPNNPVPQPVLWNIPLKGGIAWFGRADEVPTGYHLCDGANVDGYGVVPDLRGFFIVGLDPRDPDYDTVGKTGGSKLVQLLTKHLPKFRLFTVSNEKNGATYLPDDPEKHLEWSSNHRNGNQDYDLQGTGTEPTLAPTSEVGNDEGHENRPPYYTLAFIIRVVPQEATSGGGRGITSIAKTSTVGLVDTYTITYTDDTIDTFTVTNGSDGTGNITIDQSIIENSENAVAGGAVFTELKNYVKVSSGTASLNLYDKNSMVVSDAFIYGGSTGDSGLGAISPHNGWKYVRIPVQPLTTYCINKVIPSTASALRFEDINSPSNNVMLSALGFDDCVVVTGGLSFTTPANCVFVCFNVKVDGYMTEITSTLQLQLDSIVTEYQEYSTQNSGTITDNLISTNIARVSQLPDVSNFLTKSDGKNKFDKATMVIPNYGVDYTGAVGQFSGWSAAKIPVKENTIYSFSHSDSDYSANDVGQLAYLDADSNKISAVDMYSLPDAGGLGGKTITTPANCAFIIKCVIVLTHNYVNTFQLELGTDVTSYEAYGAIAITQADELVYKNTNVVVMGDSISAMPDAQNWFYYMKNVLPFKSTLNLARSGCTWKNWDATAYDITSSGGSASADNTIWQQYNRLLNAVVNGNSTPNLIILACGTNDAWYYSSDFGTIADAFSSKNTISGNAANAANTTCKAIRYVVELLRIQYPSAQIIICTPSQTYDDYNANLKTVSDLIKQCANYLGCDVIDAFCEAPFSYFCQTNYAALKPDKTHPSIDGAKLLASYKISALKKTIRTVI